MWHRRDYIRNLSKHKNKIQSTDKHIVNYRSFITENTKVVSIFIHSILVLLFKDINNYL